MPKTLHSGVTIRPVAPADLPLTADWQCRFLRDGLFPRLGHRFVSHWHATFLEAPWGVAFIAEAQGPGGPVPLGFLLGSSDQLRHVDDVLQWHRTRLGLHGVLALARRPRLCLGFLRTRGRSYLRRLFKRPATAAADAGTMPALLPRIAVITALVVDPASRHHGIGGQLVNHFLARAAEAGAPLAELVTKTGPGGAGRFYERLGWTPVHEHTTKDGETAKTYRFRLTPGTPGFDHPLVQEFPE
ncbi:GNAT family N-acetyltransferase [Paeniglutamicibacter sp. ABSL32-1]|uniref:GNAT family N-acetyltransferase n=1 Tax=Paeniglutamicibacter quisquiliarum TaxID=2849498 RepID=UPI001C2CE3C7|nr:GNAT family N-acetyltransferase [Paeniglutamicibacter quisquiliarum]MBV1778522.1 GNAT family N-acetyltransferase [Paeniglutamicibacter quisquiliarum]